MSSLQRLGVALLATVVACAQEPEAADPVEVTVPRGATLTSTARLLAEHGAVPSADLFRFYAKVSGRERSIQAGTYAIPAEASVREVLDLLGRGRPPERRVVVPEGLTLRETAAEIERVMGIATERFLAAGRDSVLRSRLDVPAETLEGYLYPSTYRVRADASPNEIVRQMVREFEARWQPAWTVRLDALDMTRHEIVTLASIIEGEVRYGPDRPYVASVYHNRLRRGMRLQADPTVRYALGERRRLFERDYLTPSPYNTYLIDGLPPGPIGSPSTASLEAALFPANTNFLYFVARPDGRHVFSRTYAEHRRAVAEVRRSERAREP
ncbi:MAG: endolytic transglycosylase MltG [Gemmatimonadales bacterium]|jgi:UPF0755 protein